MNLPQELFGHNPLPRQRMPSASEIAVRAADRAMAILRQRGGVPVRVLTNDKAAFDKGWTKPEHVAPPADARHTNVGLQTGNVIGIDCDTDDEKTAEAVLRAWAGGLPLVSMPMRYRNNSPRVLFLAKGEPGQKKVVWRIAGGGKIELLGHGQQVVVFGKHPSGAQLEWAWPSDTADSPSHALPPDLGQLPVVTAADIERCLVSAGIGFTGGLSKASPQSTAPASSTLTTTPIQNNALMTRIPSPVSEAEVQWVVDQVAMKDPSAFSDHEGAFAGGLAIAGVWKRGEIDEHTARRQVERLFARYRAYQHAESVMETPGLIAQIFRDARGDVGFGTLARPLLAAQGHMPAGWREAALSAWVAAGLPTSGTALPGASSPNSLGASATGTNAPLAVWRPVGARNWQTAKAVAKPAVLYAGGVLLGGMVTVLAAPGGRGKSAFVIGLAAYLASGQDVMGFGPCDPMRVAAVLMEEPEAIIGARIEAFQTLNPSLVIDPARTLICGQECAEGLLLWTSDVRGNPVPVEPCFEGISELMESHDIVILDALGLMLENMTGPNDPKVAGSTMRRLGALAKKHNCALLIVAHERKPKAGTSGGDAASVTGSTKWVDHARGEHNLVEPAGKEAAALGIPPGEEWRFFAVRNGKPNHTRKEPDRYFQKVGVKLASGDEAVAVQPWKPNVGVAPSLLSANRQAVIEVIAKAEAAGKPLSRMAATRARNQGETCAEIETAQALLSCNPDWHPARADAVAKQILGELKKDGALIHDEEKGTRRRIWRVAP